MHRFHADHARRFLAVGVALHTHSFGFGLGFHFIRFGFGLCADQAQVRFGLRLYFAAFLRGFGFELADLFLLHGKIAVGVLLAQTLEIGIVVRRNDARDEKFRHKQAVVRDRFVDPRDPRAQRFTEF